MYASLRERAKAAATAPFAVAIKFEPAPVVKPQVQTVR
jgi:hypothetical protein